MRPRQRCGSDHWLTEACPRGICEVRVYDKSGSVERKSDLPTDRSGVAFGRGSDRIASSEEGGQVPSEGRPSTTIDRGSGAGVAPGPLTSAERQREYRKRQGEAYRKRNRERMRRVRGG